MAKKYIPDNSWLKCDKGSVPVKLKVTHHNNSKIYGEYLANEMDMIPGENIPPLGTCSIAGGPCKFAPIYWDKCNEGVKLNGYKLVFEDANLLCQQGGKISVDFNAPSSSSGFWFSYGSVALAGQWMDYNGVLDYNQRGVIYDVEKGKLALTTDTGSQHRKGNYGEMKDQVYYREQGWRDIRKESPNMDIDKPTASGIDGAYEKGGVYRETDAKYDQAKLKTNKGSGNRELDVKWTNDHIDNGAITSAEDARRMRRANNNGSLERAVTHIDTEGNMRNIPVNDDGYRKGAGAITDIEMKPPSKASQFIQGTRSSLRNSKPVQALANSNFSAAVQSSKGATKANDALWKATQAVESSPALKTTGKVLGRGAVVVGVVLDAASIYSAYQEEGGFGDKTQQATGSAVGGMAGGWAGAEIGAVIGTAICPGIGTVVGGVVGGIVGGLIGSGAGSKIVDWLF
ncbi:hypothetical protein DRF59_01195 [Chryseobacterium flavum]|uniref:DUF4280 domain-containing protein n=1 Tax=Chryseobacterium flavum TaxID=415851 RepID=A0A3D9CUV3_9FLAO|nr:PAAR-like protein [Chryseobacterium flavum]REC69509.1 hypothetical protein DRF59_01195 [Chryseobacterium flavum]